MFFAIDKNGERVHINDVLDDETYFCPSCGEELALKKGSIKLHHFSHKSNSLCNDAWHYDMSEWHSEWQNKFPKQYQEIVKTFEGETHRADVLIEETKVVIEFQHSPLSFEEFIDRNGFYVELGYTVIWVFDVEEQYDAGYIINYEDNKWYW